MRRTHSPLVFALAVLILGGVGLMGCDRAPTVVASDARDRADGGAVALSHGPASGGVLVNERFSVPFVLGDPPAPPLNPCTGEVMEGTIDWHVVVRELDEQGENREYHMSARVEAVGNDTGRRYHGTATYNRTVNGHLGGPQSLTHHVQGGIISRGSEANWFSTLLVHTTVNAQGELTAFHFEVDEIQCRGPTG